MSTYNTDNEKLQTRLYALEDELRELREEGLLDYADFLQENVLEEAIDDLKRQLGWVV